MVKLAQPKVPVKVTELHTVFTADITQFEKINAAKWKESEEIKARQESHV